MRRAPLLFLVFFGLLAALGLTFLNTRIYHTPDDVLAHIRETKTIRCGFLTYEPFVVKNSTTGKVEGLVAEYIDTVATRNGLKIEWSDELNIGDIVPSLNNRRIDWLCVPCAPVPAFRKHLDFEVPFGHLPFYLFTRKDNPPTQEQLPTARFAAVDGYIPQYLTPQIYPSATVVGLMASTSNGELFDQIRYNKVDALIAEGLNGHLYMQKNPGQVEVNPLMPPRTLSMLFPTRKGDKEMSGYLTGIFGLQNNPENIALLKKLMAKYGITTELFCTSAADCPSLPGNL
jgi:ABC-type amino acid transport substrate-binding protein